MDGSACCAPERRYHTSAMESTGAVTSLAQPSTEISSALKLVGKNQRHGFSVALSSRLTELQEKLLADYDRVFHCEYTPSVRDSKFSAAPNTHPTLGTKLPCPQLRAGEMTDSFTQTNDEVRARSKENTDTPYAKEIVELKEVVTQKKVEIREPENMSKKDTDDGTFSSAVKKNQWNKTAGGGLARPSSYDKTSMVQKADSDGAKATLSFEEIPLEVRIQGWSYTRKKVLEILESGRFECFLALLILVDLLVMASLVQINGMHTATDVGLVGYGGRSEWTQDVKGALEATDLFFVSFYVGELLAKLYVYRQSFVSSAWNWMDLAIVIVSLVDMFLKNMPVFDGSLAKVARICRMMRISRMSQICRGADSFGILVRSLKASVGALAWSLMLMCTLIMIFALILAQSCSDYIADDAQEYTNRDMVYDRFGTFARALVSCFEVALGNWGPVTWVLLNNISMVYVLAILGFKLTVGFAVLNVINAVFLRQTMKVAEKIDAFTIEQRRKAAASYEARLHDIFREIDTSGDGKITYEEFAEVVGTDSMKAWMGLLEIQVHELDDLFMMLDDGDGQIEREEFVRGVLRIKGEATAVDAMSLMAGINRIERKLDKYTGKDVR